MGVRRIPRRLPPTPLDDPVGAAEALVKSAEHLDFDKPGDPALNGTRVGRDIEFWPGSEVEKVDGRSVTARRLRESYDGLIRDQGGKGSVTVVQKSLCRAYAGNIVILERLSMSLVLDPERTIAAWLEIQKAMAPIARLLGLHRDPKLISGNVDPLDSYLKSKGKKE